MKITLAALVFALSGAPSVASATELKSVSYNPVRGLEVKLVEGFANLGGAKGTSQVGGGDLSKLAAGDEVSNPGTTPLKISINGVTIVVPAGASFKFGGVGKNGVEISGVTGTVSVETGKSAASVSSGQTIAAATEGGKTTMAVLAGPPVTIVTDGKKEVVKPGFAMTATESTAPAATKTADADTDGDSLPVVTVITVVVAPLQETNSANTNTCTNTTSPSSPSN